MDRLEQIKNEVARENGYKSFNDMMWTESHVSTIEVILRDVVRRYAAEMVRHNLERAANKTHKVDGYSTIVTFTGLEQKAITSLEIELI